MDDRSRCRYSVYPRQLAAFFLHKAGISQSAIGRIFGQDHTTIRYGILKIDKEKDFDNRVLNDVFQLGRQLEKMMPGVRFT